jgi:isoleucyl-tRNA synthetase
MALQELEQARKTKTIGKALEAKIKVHAESSFPFTGTVELEPLRELLNVSQLEVSLGQDTASPPEIFRADGQKCERCWHWETDVGSNPEHPTLCGRCVEAVKQSSIPKI